MRRRHRIVLLAGLVALMPVLSACENFDPDKLDVFGLNEKKKLPGDRRPVFPEGVPGVQQGIPPEFVKGNQLPPDAAQTPLPGEAAAKSAAVDPEEKPKPKPKRVAPKPPAAAQLPPPNTAQFPTRVTVQPQSQQQQAQPQDQQPAPQPAQAPWPSSPAPGSR